MTSAISVAVQKNGGCAETPRQWKNRMLQVAEKPEKAKLLTKVGSDFITASPDKKAAEWLEGHIAKSQDKITTIVADLTPALARVLLNRNEANRKLRQRVVDSYARDMKGGSWDFNGEPIIIAKNGMVNDGQHRLAALILADVTIPVVFIIGVARETRNTLDQGIVRRLSDYLEMDGRTHTQWTATVATFIWWHTNTGTIATRGTLKPTKSELYDLIDKHTNIYNSIRYCDHKGARSLGGVPLVAFVHWTIRKGVQDKSEADNFVTGLLEGAGLSSKSPILYVRNRLAAEGNRYNRNAKAELLFKAWNAHRKGETVRQFYVTGGQLPKLEK